MNKNLIRSGFKGEQIVVVPRGLIKKYHTQEFVNSLYLTDIGFFPNATNHYRQRDSGCDEYILIYCIEGYGQISTKDKTHTVGPNSFFIIEKHEKHTYFTKQKNPWSIYWVHFDGRKATYLYDKFTGLKNGSPIFIPFNQNKVSEFEYMLGILKLGYTDQVFEYSSMLLHKLLGSFIYYSLPSQNNPELAKVDLVKRISEYLNANIYRSLTLSDVEREFNKSSSALFSVFKEKTGYSIIHFFNLIKIQKACELMNLTSLSVKEISFKLDYSDPLYFSRVFKKYMGMSPTGYRSSL